jgi:hypothetical protein
MVEKPATETEKADYGDSWPGRVWLDQGPH